MNDLFQLALKFTVNLHEVIGLALVASIVYWLIILANKWRDWRK